MAAKNRPASSPPPPAASGGPSGFEVLRLTTAPVPEDAAPRPRVTVFAIDGTEHTMLADPTVNEALAYIEVIQRRGPDAGLSFLMNFMYGEESYQALLGYRELTKEHFAQVVNVARERLLGPLEAPKAT